MESISLCTNTGVAGVQVLKFQCKPRQRGEDPINKVPYYSGWILIDVQSSTIINAHCACKGGADGACRHAVAAIFEIIEYSEEAHKVSVTSQPCQWKRKSRKSGNPGPISELKTALPGQVANEPPLSDYYDPCPTIKPNVDEFYNGLKQLKPSANLLLNRYKPEELSRSGNIVDVQNLIEQFRDLLDLYPDLDNVQELGEFVVFTKKDIEVIEKITRGQHTNKLWYHYRQGLLTASNFHTITHMRDSTDPTKFMRYLLTPKSTFSNNLPPALEWGRSREEIARKLFLAKHRSLHGNVRFEEMGLVVDAESYFLGASPDGKVHCQVCGVFLIEIKCPYAHRHVSSHVAALSKKCILHEGELSLDPQSIYYAQIQGQMGVCGIERSRLVVYTTKDITIVDVPFDLEYWKSAKQTLAKFYYQHFGEATLQHIKQQS